jgi:hypothetical protein
MYATLFEALQFKGEAGAKAIIDEVLNVCPEVTGIDKYNGGRKIPLDYGTEDKDTMETLFMTSVPEVDPFRNANTGVLPIKGTFEKRITQLATATAYWSADKAVIEKNPQAGAQLMLQRANATMKSHVQALGKQFFYGTKNGGSPLGFNGLLDLIDGRQVVTAGGTGNKLTSAYFVWFNEDGVSWRYGMNGAMTMSEPREVTLTDPADPAKKFPGIEQYMQYYPGLKVSNRYSVGRIANIDVSSAYTGQFDPNAFRDEHVYNLLTKLPGGMRPNVCFLPYVAALLLAASRTTVNISQSANGNPVIVGGMTPPVTEFEGILFVPTDSIKIGETAVSVS